MLYLFLFGFLNFFFLRLLSAPFYWSECKNYFFFDQLFKQKKRSVNGRTNLKLQIDKHSTFAQIRIHSHSCSSLKHTDILVCSLRHAHTLIYLQLIRHTHTHAYLIYLNKDTFTPKLILIHLLGHLYA